MTRTLPVLSDYGISAQLPPVFDHTVTGTFGECERMALYQHVWGRVFEGRSFNLHWGTVFHGCADLWLTTQGNVDAVVAYITEQLDEDTDDRYGRNRGRMFELFLAWVTYRQNNPLKILRSEQSIMVKCDSSEHCPYFPDKPNGCGLMYGGRMDNVVEWQGMRGPLDYKTTTMDDSDPLTDWRPSHQLEGYVWAASHLMQEHCWGAIVERLICNKSKLKIDRTPVSFSRDVIREWVMNEIVTQRRLEFLFQNFPNDESAWRQNYFRCGKPWACHYRDVCLTSRDFGFRYKWLSQNTVEKRWDFTNPDKDDSKVVAGV